MQLEQNDKNHIFWNMVFWVADHEWIFINIIKKSYKHTEITTYSSGISSYNHNAISEKENKKK